VEVQPPLHTNYPDGRWLDRAQLDALEGTVRKAVRAM
jgi:hypothetical protein